MNLHTPERLAGEPFDEYRARRKASHEANARNGRPENWKPETRRTGSPFISPPLEALFRGWPLPKLKKRKSRKVRGAPGLTAAKLQAVSRLLKVAEGVA